MADRISKFTLRAETDLLKKLQFIAKYNGRSSNQELTVLIRKYIEKYEQKHGEIRLRV